MTDIILAELNGNGWLVSGEAFLDDLLMNTLADEVSIEVVPCTSQQEVYALWVEYCGDPGTAVAPWSIHPGIIARVHRTLRGANNNEAILFAPWSAMLDAPALAAIEGMAARAAQARDQPVVLTEYRSPAQSGMIGDLTRLRIGLITEQLVGAGVPRERISHVVADAGALEAAGPEPQRIDIALEPTPTA